MSVKHHIPNAITLLNLLSGSVAAILAVQNHFTAAAFFVFLGIFFDFFDGFIARKLQVQSALGVQLDSLADVVTSGLVPGIVMFKLLALSVGAPDWDSGSGKWNTLFNWSVFEHSLLPLLGLLITLASAYRLAKFNIDEDQQSYFKGLPTPANALIILSLPLIVEFHNSDALNALILNPWFLVVLTFVSCYLLNSNIKLFALKFKTFGFKANAVRYIFLILSLILLVVLQFAAIPVVIVLYILMSLLSSYSKIE